MKLFTEAQERRLKTNGQKNADLKQRSGCTIIFKPVVKLFCPWGAATWLLTEIDPAEPTVAFGLCDLGMGSPEIGNVSLAELESIRGPGGLRIERDLHFKADKTLSGYADGARRVGRIMA
jgi:Protein of unknown function (DUF2958)